MRIRNLLSILFFLTLVYPSFSNDSIRFEERSFQKETLEEYRNQKEFRYNSNPSVAKSSWDILKERFFSLIQKFFSNRGIMPVVRYILLGVAVLFILLRILGMNTNAVFGRKQSALNSNYQSQVTDIVAINFENEAKVACEQQNFRLAIRYLFLHCLQLLEVKELIKWSAEKTNTNYLRELHGKKLLPDFKRIVRGYNFVWYGHFDIGEKGFVGFRDEIEQFKSKIDRENG